METKMVLQRKSLDRPGRTAGTGPQQIAVAVVEAMHSARLNDRVKVIRIREVCERTSLSKGQIQRLVNLGQFPKPMALSEKRRGWVDNEISEWIAEKMRGRESGSF
jgi:prophage regulatory protein